MNEFNLLSTEEQIAWCRSRLRYFQEEAEKLQNSPWSSEKEEALRQVEETRQQLLQTLDSLEHPTLWRRLNRAVNGAAARNAVNEDLKRRGKRSVCPLCSGTGRRPAFSGNYFETCECGGVVSTYQGSPEIDEAQRAADRLRRQIDR
jgi:hypothetical protein